MALSTILEMNARLLTGLKFCFINSKPIFFSNGLTTAVFHLMLYSPLVSDVLTILVISGQTTGKIFLSMCVGMSSNSQVFGLHLLNYKRYLLLRHWGEFSE